MQEGSDSDPSCSKVGAVISGPDENRAASGGPRLKPPLADARREWTHGFSRRATKSLGRLNQGPRLAVCQ